jgi:hypothetical protein
MPFSDEGTHIDAPELRVFVLSLFFIFGVITSLNDVIIPKLKELFTLSYTEAFLVQFCFFTAYLVIGIPGAMLGKRIGHMRGAVVGLLTMMAGWLLFVPASASATYAITQQSVHHLPALPTRMRDHKQRPSGDQRLNPRRTSDRRHHRGLAGMFLAHDQLPSSAACITATR